MVYEYRQGYSFKIPAQVAGEEIQKIEYRNGSVTKEEVLESARSEESPLHPAFEWDDKIAAEKHRLHQANMLINTIVIRPEENPEKEVRAFVNVGDQTKGRFISVKVALADPDTRDTVLGRAFGELASFKRKYENLSELAELIAVIDKVLKEAS